ncbi:hypothetical protein C8R47DRAFT_576219 [Mycena vitilis]|nr:hypothetical protein C8R47DRAFT_576219 [Mycena vitilis]
MLIPVPLLNSSRITYSASTDPLRDQRPYNRQIEELYPGHMDPVLNWKCWSSNSHARGMNLAIVDDKSSQIEYTGLWTAGGTSNHYDHTASASRAAGATMTFPFSGTSVSLVGSFDANTTCTGSFSLDANVTTFSSSTVPTPLNHQSIWTSTDLSDAPHTLTYTVTSCSSTNNATGNVWLDYILYTPSSNASTNELLYFVDDSDSRIDYFGNWIAETGNDEDFELTSHGGKEGSSFQLDFDGIFVSVHGRIGNDSINTATQVSFSVDGSPPVLFSTPYQSTISFNQPLFNATLGPGKHSLVATSQSGTVWVDYLILQPNASTSTTLPVSPPHSAIGIGEIAGAAAGVLVLAICIALLVIFRRRLFKGWRPRATPSRPLSRPPNIHEYNSEDAPSSNNSPPQSTDSYPPSPLTELPQF